MKFSTRTIFILVALSLISASPAAAMMAASGDKTLTISGSAGLAGVKMTGLPGNPITSTDGSYQVTVDYGWSGKVTPTKEGYTFEPASMVYTKITINRSEDNYVPSIITFIISGHTGVGGVMMQGLPGPVVSDQRGYYSVELPYGWSGVIRPIKNGYDFDPSAKNYPKVLSNLTRQDYDAKPEMLTISGRILVGGVPIEGVLISADNKGGSVVTDARGSYRLEVPYGWSGELTPKKEGMDFNPPSLKFTNVTTDIVDNKPVPPRVRGTDPYASFGASQSRRGRRGYASEYDDMMMYGPSGSPSRGRSSLGYKPSIRSGGRKVLVIPAGRINTEEFAETIEDMHVMSHILDEQFKQKRRIQGFFTDFGAFFGRDSRNTEATYLQDYGVLFLMEVNFVFSPPPKRRAQDPSETTEAVDSTWQKARQQVFSPGASPRMDAEDSARDYDTQMVEELKKELVEALRHAGNIRNVDPNEWVILTVIGGQRQSGMGFGGGMGGGMSGFGGSPRSGGTSGGAMGGGYGGGGFMMGGYGEVGGMMGGGMGGMYSGMGTYSGTTVSSTSTVLTIRAKKANVDDFAKGRTDLGQFQEHVQIFMY